MAITKDTVFYDGANAKLDRLGLRPLVDEIFGIIAESTILVLQEREANGAAEVRMIIDAQFAKRGGWVSAKAGDIDWMKCKSINGTKVCVGVEVQVSARSELLYKDILHLRTRITTGDIDVGVIIVPSDRLQSFLPDRTPSISYAKQGITETDAHRLPIMLIEIEHDGPGPALRKKRTNMGRGSG